MSSAIRGNSLYTIVDGPRWTEAQANAVSLGGNLATINGADENQWLFSNAILGWIGYTDQAVEGQWHWISGESSTYTNWDANNPDNAFSAEDYAYLDGGTGTWNDIPNNYWQFGNPFPGTPAFGGIAEIPLTSSIAFSATPAEGAGVFTTSINLSAGTAASGNLANGTTVYWTITGITAGDLASGALTGSGTITNGKLDIQHSLKVDADTGEQFSVSVYSDSARTLQIGNTESRSIGEAVVSTGATTTSRDSITGHRTFDLSTATSKVTGDDGIIDRFTLQTNAAPANPWRITAFNPTEDILQIPAELTSRTAAKSFFGVQKVVIPDRPLTKSEQKSYKKQQKAVSKSVKRIGTTGDGFVYNQLTGELFLDTNGSKKGFGEGGGLLAVLEDTPAIGINNFQFL